MRGGPLRAAVIGSGFGGLAAAIRLQARGIDTVIFEKRDRPGGRAYVYEDKGFTFDAGPTVITAPNCIEELFTVAGRRMADYVELLPVNPFYRLAWSDGDSFDYTGDSAAMEEQIGRRNPRDVAGYRAFVEYARKVFVKGYEELGATPFLRFADMVRVAPDLVHIHNIGPACFSPLLRLFGLPVVLTYHSPNYEHAKWGAFAKMLLKGSEWIAFRCASAVVFVNKFQMEKAPAAIRKKSRAGALLRKTAAK